MTAAHVRTHIRPTGTAAGHTRWSSPDQTATRWSGNEERMHAEAEAQAEQAPLFTVAKGNPSAEELAALTAVVLALQSSSTEDETGGKSRRRGSRRRELLRPVVQHGPGAWRHTFR
ncbi:acyl-CoA carboxylase subunit epsilon [Arthrobacter crystallopoietes]|uniref:Acyl-CoA carboxylase epsilon subunit n=1 Tax=Crystallibacter crystallopoietes TaxID=37928 RepID=A0A1H0ZAT7_9MICC|nr:acyl-CoA carboxylase subunit epsilon [Arthrobacter crystallopoietes]SDQ24524.1 Acyl-CoA carboxylase epsilon subunit [Arthrobacter crystallopoietes]